MNHLFLDFVRAIYRFQSSQELVSTIVSGLLRLVPGDNVMIGSHDASQRRLQGVVLRTPFSHGGFLPEANQTGLIGVHPFWDRILDPIDTVKVLSDMVSDSAWRKNAFNREILRHDRVRDHINVEFGESPSCFTTVGVIRSSPGFPEADRRMMARLQPHLRQAFANAQIVDQWAGPRERGWHSDEVWDNLLLVDVEGLLRNVLGSGVMDSHDPNFVRFRRWLERERDLLDRGALTASTGGLRLRAGADFLLFLLDRSCGDWKYRLRIRRTRFPAENPSPALTLREQEVLRWAAEGKSNEKIACILSMSPGTVKVHLRNIYRKLEVDNRTAAVMKFRSLTPYSDHVPNPV